MQQRIHPVTKAKLEQIKLDINKQKVRHGEKPLTVPDVLELLTNHWVKTNG